MGKSLAELNQFGARLEQIRIGQHRFFHANVQHFHMSGYHLIHIIDFTDFFDKNLPRWFKNFDGDVVEQVLKEIEHSMT